MGTVRKNIRTIRLDEDLLSELVEYVELNNLNIDTFVSDLVRKSFLIEKYGDAPAFIKKKPIIPDIIKNLTDENKKEPEKQEIKDSEGEYKQEEALPPVAPKKKITRKIITYHE